MHLDLVLLLFSGLLFTGLLELRDLGILLILENVFPSLCRNIFMLHSLIYHVNKQLLHIFAVTLL